MARVTNPAHEVILGGLALMQTGKPVTYADGYTLEVSGDDATWGNPKSVVTTLLSMLSSGSVLHREGDDNREPSFQVIVSAPLNSGLALAKGEKALRSVTEEPATLEWLPPQAGAARAVFDVVDSHLEHVMDDIDELNVRRKFRITMSALPYARSAALSTVPAIAFAAPVVVNDGSATTGWTVDATATLSTATGAVISTYNSATITGTYLQLTTSINTSVTKYIAVDWKSSLSAIHGLRTSDSPTTDIPEVRREAVAGGWTRSYYKMPDTLASLSYVRLSTLHPLNTVTATLSIDQIQRMQALPTVGTAQQIRTIDVGGSAPTQGSIDVTHATANLNTTIVYTYPTSIGYTPPLSPWYATSGTPARTVDTGNCVSGAYNDITAAAWALVPASSIPPGEYLLVARMANITPPTADIPIFYQAKSWMGGVTVGDIFTGTTTVNLPAGLYTNVTLGVLNLPPTRVGSAGLIQIVIQRGAGATQTIRLDEFWLFRTDGDLTIVNAGTNKRLRIQAPDLSDANGAIYVANDPSWSDSYSASHLASSRSQHTFEPGLNNIFTVTETLASVDVAATLYRRWHTHPES